MIENIEYVVAARKIELGGTRAARLGLRICQIDRDNGIILDESPEWVTDFIYPDYTRLDISAGFVPAAFPEVHVKNLKGTQVDVCWYDDLVKSIPSKSAKTPVAFAADVIGNESFVAPDDLIEALPERGEVEPDDIDQIYQSFDNVTQTVDPTVMPMRKQTPDGKTITLSE